MKKQINNLTFFFCILFFSQNIALGQSTEDIFVCFGDYIFLPAQQTFPVGPGGGGICTPQISSIRINSEDMAVANDLQGYTMQPTVSQIVEITSIGVCGGPGASNQGMVTTRYALNVPISCASNIVKEEITICKGETVFIPAIQTFPTPPLGGNCTPTISSIDIHPNIYAEPDGLSGFHVNPNTTMDFIITSNGSCGAPGIGGNSDVVEKYYRIIVATECEPVEEITICRGETAFLPAVQTFPTPPSTGPSGGGPMGGPDGPSGPPNTGNCTPLLSRIEISPNTAATADDLNGFNVTPTTTTEYVVTSRGFCGGLHSPDVTDTEEKKYKVIVEEGCPTTTPPANEGLFAELPWLSSFVNPTNCIDETIFIYQRGIFRYALIKNSQGEERLYLDNNGQSGSFQCLNAVNYDCVAAYNLGTPTDFWSCGENIGIEETNTVNDNTDIFTNFSWLSTVINPNDCKDILIEIHQVGDNQYVFIDAPQGATLYNQDGIPWCRNGSNLDCVSFYSDGLVDSWRCNNFSSESPTVFKASRSVFVSSTVQMYPNPTTGTVMIDLGTLKKQDHLEINMYTTQGQLLQSFRLSGNSRQAIDLATYPDGLYLFEWTEYDKRKIKKILKQ